MVRRKEDMHLNSVDVVSNGRPTTPMRANSVYEIPLESDLKGHLV